MHAKLKVFLALLALSCAVGCFCLLLPPADPMQKTVEAEIKFMSLNWSNQFLAEKNLLALGPSVIPYLAEASLKTNSDFQEWVALKINQTTWLQQLQPNYMDSDQARLIAGDLLRRVLMGNEMAPAIPRLLGNPDGRIRGMGCSALVSRIYRTPSDDREFVQELTPFLESPDPLVRAVVVYVLSERGDGSQISPENLMKLCHDTDESVRFEAARALLKKRGATAETLHVLKQLTLSEANRIRLWDSDRNFYSEDSRLWRF